jgi:hypothetical protein
MTWRQPPQGAVGRESPPTTAMASIRRAPLETATATALRSAQTLKGKALFSTFGALYTRPFASTAAPTANPEYGAYARVLASAAARSRRSSSTFSEGTAAM